MWTIDLAGQHFEVYRLAHKLSGHAYTIDPYTGSCSCKRRTIHLVTRR